MKIKRRQDSIFCLFLSVNQSDMFLSGLRWNGRKAEEKQNMGESGDDEGHKSNRAVSVLKRLSEFA